MIKRKSITIVQGVFDNSFFDFLKKRNARETYVMEGRPGLEAAKRSTRELIKRKIKPILITDNMAGFFFYKGLVKEVWMSYQYSDNKGAICHIGGLILGVLSKKHKIPVYIFPTGPKIKLLGKARDLLYFNGTKVAPTGTATYVPLAEWVPARYIKRVYNGKV